MTPSGTLVWGAAGWVAVAAPLAAALVALLAWGYWRAGATPGVRALAAGLKLLGILILALCLLEPLLSGTRARPGANQFVVLADNSQSMSLRDRGSDQTRAEQLRSLWPPDAAWTSQLRQVFDVRSYAFDTQLRPLGDGATDLAFDGGGSALGASLDRVVRRFQGRPLAGVLLLTDGNATDADAAARLASEASAGGARVPPIYPVLLGREDAADDLSVQHVAVTQTGFEDAPVTITAQLTGSGYDGRTVVATLLDETGKSVEQQKVSIPRDGQPATARFRVRPEQAGVSFYRVSVGSEGQPPLPVPTTAPAQPGADGPRSDEATLANNSRLVAVDRDKGPYRVLYVGGRPNWEYKFLQRAVRPDDQVQLVGLLRIARREPKFGFLDHRRGEDANPLFRGFDVPDAEQVEQYDQPVLVRLGTVDEHELRGGFPKSAEELYRYHAVVLDDLEAEFFTQDQMQLLKDFVRRRGGGLLMLGGTESFRNGGFDRTPVGDLLPVYLDEAAPEAVPSPGARYRLALTREGWLEPWIRLRADEDAERTRVGAMPSFQTLNGVRGAKPGATVLVSAEFETGASVPALVEQRFGRGRVGAMLVGDLWRWGLRREEQAEADFEKAWRQTVRWLVSDVPQRVEVDVASGDATADGSAGAVTLRVRVRDEAYAPLDNAAVTVRVTGPDGKPTELTAEAGAQEPGLYEAAYVPRQPGAYRAQVTASAPDGSEVAQAAATGWTSEPAAEEFRELKPNRALLEGLARGTGGEVVAAADLERFVAGLPTRHAEITEPYVRPVWHQAWVFLLAIACLTAEWGLRRWKGLP